MEQQRERRISRTGQAGFSLLEMLVALAILSAAAYVALDTVESDTGQTRYQITENRLEKIRRAIVGNPDLVLNGAPVVSGYVADVGRLPECLQALLVRDSECNLTNHATSPLLYAEVAPGLWTGWRGPYLTAASDNGLPLGTAAANEGLPDGWGNGAVGGVDYGWTVQLNGTNATDAKLGGPSTEITQFDVSSLGLNRAVGGDPGTYEVDQDMVQVAAHDYKVDLNQVRFQVHVSATRKHVSPDPSPEPDPEITNDYCLALLDVNPADVTSFRLIPAVDAMTTVTIPVGQPTSAGSQTMIFTANQTTTQGYRPLVLYEATDGACLATGGEADLNDLSTPGAPKNPVVARFGLVLAPRMAHTGTYSATVSIVEP